jgi:hypothetical protein
MSGCRRPRARSEPAVIPELEDGRQLRHVTRHAPGGTRSQLSWETLARKFYGYVANAATRISGSCAEQFNTAVRGLEAHLRGGRGDRDPA